MEFHITDRQRVRSPAGYCEDFAVTDTEGNNQLTITVENGGPNAIHIAEATVLKAVLGGRSVDTELRPPVREEDALNDRVVKFAQFAVTAL